MTFHDLCFFHYFPGLENGLPQFRDFPWPGGILFKRKGPHTRNERRVPELIPVLGSQPAGDRSHKPGGSLPLLSVRHAITSPAAEHHRRWPGTELYCSVTEAHVCVNNLPRVALGSAPAGIRIRDPFIARPSP